MDLRGLPFGSGSAFKATWQFSSGVVVRGEVTLSDHSGALVLRYGCQQQLIVLESLPRHYGGAQWYARCPISGARVLTLWMAPGASLFASRHAWTARMAYASQFEGPLWRASAKRERLLRQLGGPAPQRSARRHQSTHLRLLQRMQAIDHHLESLTRQALERAERRSSLAPN